jgi:hypothetical protein
MRKKILKREIFQNNNLNFSSIFATIQYQNNEEYTQKLKQICIISSNICIKTS